MKRTAWKLKCVKKLTRAISASSTTRVNFSPPFFISLAIYLSAPLPSSAKMSRVQRPSCRVIARPDEAAIFCTGAAV